MLWEVDIHPAEGQPDLTAHQVAVSAAELGIASDLAVSSARGYLIQGELDQRQIARLAEELLADRVVERPLIAPVGAESLLCPSPLAPPPSPPPPPPPPPPTPLIPPL